MKKEQRPAATGFCANVEKMDLYAVDRREKLRVSVQACLDRAPIIVVSPVGLDALQKFDLRAIRSEEHTSELQSLMRISYAVFCLKKKKTRKTNNHTYQPKIKTDEITTY